MSPLKIGSLFSGIGGLELGLERSGLGHVAWQCEIDPFCSRVLAKHWPNVTRFEDVRTAKPSPVDLICGGFPCQDVSSAGKRAGLSGSKSGLWFEYRRIVEELRPRFVIVENVASGKKLWLPKVKEDLEALGYRVRAFALSAFEVGAPHLRKRIFIVASTDPHGIELREQHGRRGSSEGPDRAPVLAVDGLEGIARDPHGTQRQGDRSPLGVKEKHSGLGYPRIPRDARDPHGEGKPTFPLDGEVAGVPGVASGTSPWASPPLFRGVDDGFSGRLDRSRRLKALGNAVVPQCAEAIGRLILAHCTTETPP